MPVLANPAGGATVDVTLHGATVRSAWIGPTGNRWVTVETVNGTVLDVEPDDDSVTVRAGVPEGEDLLHGLTEDDLTGMRHEPSALVLPDGWHLYADCYQLVIGREQNSNAIFADTTGIEMSIGGCDSPAAARALAARLVEAAGIVEQIRAGATPSGRRWLLPAVVDALTPSPDESARIVEAVPDPPPEGLAERVADAAQDEARDSARRRPL
jgi:hypothetical protein